MYVTLYDVVHGDTKYLSAYVSVLDGEILNADTYRLGDPGTRIKVKRADIPMSVRKVIYEHAIRQAQKMIRDTERSMDMMQRNMGKE